MKDALVTRSLVVFIKSPSPSSRELPFNASAVADAVAQIG